MGQMMSNLGSGINNLGSNLGNLGNIGEANWGDLSGGEKFARLLGGGAKGLGQGYQNMQQQNSAMRQGGGGGTQIPMPQQPTVDFSQMISPGPQGPGISQPGAKKPNPYFYGYGQ